MTQKELTKINVIVQDDKGKEHKFKAFGVWIDWKFENDEQLDGDGDANYFSIYNKKVKDARD